MQTSISRRQRILPEMSRALQMESGILDESRLSGSNDDCSNSADDFILVVFLYGFSFQIN